MTTHKTTTAVATYIQALTQLGYTFALNLCGSIVEVNGKRLEDIELATIRARMRQNGFTSMAAVEDVIHMDAASHKYHPIKNYLKMCGMNYDGGQHIAFLGAHFTETTEPHKLFPTWLRRWMIGTVAKVFGDGHNQNPMLVLDGPQNLGKSYFAWWLCSQKEDYFIESSINTSDKDNLVRLIENWIWEVSELGATTRKSDVESLKAFVTQRKVTVRRPWGRMDMVKPAMASLIGTVNNSAGILADQTGNRRFLVSTISKIDWNYSKDIDPNQAWGEAYAAFQAGENWRPSPKELQMSEENNESFKFPNVVKGYLVQHFHIDPTDVASWTPTATIVARLQKEGYRASSSGGTAMRVAATLKEMKVRKERRTINKQQTWGYVGVKEIIPTSYQTAWNP